MEFLMYTKFNIWNGMVFSISIRNKYPQVPFGVSGYIECVIKLTFNTLLVWWIMIRFQAINVVQYINYFCHFHCLIIRTFSLSKCQKQIKTTMQFAITISHIGRLVKRGNTDNRATFSHRELALVAFISISVLFNVE